MRKFVLVYGTRPCIIKMAPVVFEFQKYKKFGIEYRIVNTNQNFVPNLNKMFVKELNLRDDFVLTNSEGSSGRRFAEFYINMVRYLVKEKMQDSAVVVYGDTMSAMACALAAKSVGAKIVHIEAGLRSGDLTMPEEVSRIVIDSIADYLFVPTELNMRNLLNEKVNGRIFVVGNTIVDSLKMLKSRKVQVKRPYWLMTLHRPENVDEPMRFRRVFRYVSRVAGYFGRRVYFPVHPRVLSNLVVNPGGNGIIVCEAFSHSEFIAYLRNAELVLTDSGGVQEEAAILKVPCVTLRKSTERQELVNIGCNVLCDVGKMSYEKFLAEVCLMLDVKKEWKHPYGENVAKKIVERLVNEEN